VVTRARSNQLTRLSAVRSCCIVCVVSCNVLQAFTAIVEPNDTNSSNADAASISPVVQYPFLLSPTTSDDKCDRSVCMLVGLSAR